MSPVCVQVSDELKQKELSKAEKEDSVRVKKQTIDLMPDAENNLAKLQALVEGSAKRVVNLAAQWEKRRAPLIDEHRRLKELCSNQEVALISLDITKWVCLTVQERNYYFNFHSFL